MTTEKCPLGKGKHDYGDYLGLPNPRDTRIQIYLSVALGLGAVATFCVGLSHVCFALLDGFERLRKGQGALPPFFVLVLCCFLPSDQGLVFNL